jgi:hypothetical protein
VFLCVTIPSTSFDNFDTDMYAIFNVQRAAAENLPSSAKKPYECTAWHKGFPTSGPPGALQNYVKTTAHKHTSKAGFLPKADITDEERNDCESADSSGSSSEDASATDTDSCDTDD